MKNILLNNKINILFLLISFIFLIFIVGFKNISFFETQWLHYASETSLYHTGWNFFKNDVWRFPPGANPNFGYPFGSSIVFSDSIPILALFFKLFKSLIPNNFQYFSLWYFISFFLQLFFSFRILKKFTSSELYSFVGSIFFLIAPFFIWRIHVHAALVGQWVLLASLYLALNYEISEKKISWLSLIVLSSLIFFYFTVMILTIYFLLRIFNLKFNKNNIFQLVVDFLIILFSLFLVMYLAGFFEIRIVDSMGVGFGYYKLNILSVIDSTNSVFGVSWSLILPDIKLSEGEELDGFNYFGLGQILMLSLSIMLLLNKNNRTNIFADKNIKKIKIFIFVALILTFWSLSNKISFGSHTLLEIPLNKYIFGLLSIAKNTGRFFWTVNYFLLFLSLIIIYKCFNKKNSLLLVLLFLFIQSVDTSNGIKSRMLQLSNWNEYIPLQDKIWDNLFSKYKILMTTNPKSWESSFPKYTYSMEKYNIKKTNLVLFARANRHIISRSRYELYNNLRKRNLLQNAIYIIPDIGHLRHLKYLYKNTNVGFFYRDNTWLMVANEKKLMNDNDKKMFKKIETYPLNIGESNDVSFNSKKNYFGLGWSHNQSKPGIWSDGEISTLFIKTEKSNGDLQVDIDCYPYITKKNKKLELSIYINNSLNKKLNFEKNNKNTKITFLIKMESTLNNEVKVDFVFNNLSSPYEILESPDTRKLGILLKSIEVNPV